MLKKLDAIARRAAGGFQFLAPLLSRAFVAHAFYVTGKGKLGNLEGVTQFFTELGIPAPGVNAWFVSHLELYGAFVLGLGFGPSVTPGAA